MIKDKVQKALNNQLNEELGSSYVYLSMAAFFEAQNLNGFAHWMKLQSQEEYGHAMKIYSYINQRNGTVNLLKIDAPKSDWKNHIEVFESTYEQEQKVSESINNLVELALTEKDHATNNFLQWFVSEQVEEEATALYILDKAKLIGDNRNGIFLLDRELGMRAAEK
jgi:ferritin